MEMFPGSQESVWWRECSGSEVVQLAALRYEVNGVGVRR